MEAHVLDSQRREKLGKKGAKKIRRNGYIPAVLYGHSANRNISIKALDFETLFNEAGEHSIISVNINGKESFDAIVKDFQIDPIKKDIIHVDFFEIERGKLLKTEVPIKMIGTSNGVKKGGILETTIKDIEIECMPKDIPNFIKVDVTDLEIGDSLHVKNVKVARGVRIISNADQVVLSIVTPSVMAAPVEEEVAEGAKVSEETVEEEKSE